MHPQNAFKLILRSKEFMIPPDFHFIADVDQDIYSSLLYNKEYEVKSNVSEEIFQSFINYWINRQIPNINIDNISEYFLLSNEFSIMNNLIQTFRKYTSDYVKFSTNQDLQNQNKNLNKKIIEKSQKLKEKTGNFHQIIQILFNNNGICMSYKLPSVKKNLIARCEKEDFKFVNLLIQKEFKENDLSFILDEEKKNAFLFQNYSTESDIIIPRSVFCNSQEYVVTCIIENAFQFSKCVKSIQFPEDSGLLFIDKNAFSHSTLETIKIPSKLTKIDESAFSFCTHLKTVFLSNYSNLKTIEKCAFQMSTIENLSIPSNIIELKEGWCCSVTMLNRITIIPQETVNITYLNDTFLVGKSDTKSDTFDVLLFARRDIEIALIPSSVKKIGSYSFSNCSKLQKVIFPKDTELASIGSFAFAYSSLESITIPSTVSFIGESLFTGCKRLKTVEISEDSKLNSFNKYVFSRSSIEYIRIPSHFTNIGESAFLDCKELKTVEFSENSKLKAIEYSAFANTSLERISIPSSVTQICEKAFWGCKNFESIEFSMSSELKIIEKYALSNSSLQRVIIPSSVAILKEGWCYETPQLTEITVLETNQKGQYISPFNKNGFVIGKSFEKSDTYDVLVFAPRSIEDVVVPSFVRRIAPHAFNKCLKLKKVDFEKNSKLNAIDKSAFFNSSLEEIVIPSQVAKIGELAFSGCRKLKRVVFEDDSQLKLIKKNAFSFSSLENFVVPPKVTQIGEAAFSNCSRLLIIEVSQNSRIGLIDINVFKNSSVVIMVPPKLWE